ncbi:uncharacterized protein LOC125076227 [Vanessa atalanta]|uniref:uncharacterized protein LOC125076227 n=1 Tax=Vanessa atalanta TaxID=42275 RepID=UPI001FCE2AE5|nr:uncharacterized protein LOC125076227 [Vanessa atalanta]
MSFTKPSETGKREGLRTLVMYAVIIFLLSAGNISCLTCKEVVVVSKNTNVTLKDLEKLSSKEIVNCLSHLGRVKLNNSQAGFIWNSIIDFYKDISNIPNEVLSLLRWITIAIKPKDYQNLTLSNLDVITNFGLDYGLSKEQLSAIADRVREDKEPEDYTFYDLSALRQILCVFEGDEIERIHPKAYKEAAVLIGKLKHCNYDVFEGFAKLALDKDAFGSPDYWKIDTICILGGVAKYLPEEVTLKLKGKLGDDFLKETDKHITREEDCDD